MFSSSYFSFKTILNGSLGPIPTIGPLLLLNYSLRSYTTYQFRKKLCPINQVALGNECFKIPTTQCA